MLIDIPGKGSKAFFAALLGCYFALLTGCGPSPTTETGNVESPATPESDHSPNDVPAVGSEPTGEATAGQDSRPDVSEPEPTMDPASPGTEITEEATAESNPEPEESSAPAVKDTVPLPPEGSNAERKIYPDPPGLRRLSPEFNVWSDPVNKELVMVSEVVLREGGLELFACLKNTKEHEAIVAIDTQAFLVHAGLLALGAEAGHPVIFRPEYQKATGTPIDVLLEWKDPETGETRHAKAQDWILNIETGKAMDSNWVFGGSSFWEDELNNQQYYLAEDGDLICVANFHSAMLDVPIESSQANDNLMFDAYTERIPPLGTEVWVRLKPVFDESESDRASDPAGEDEN